MHWNYWIQPTHQFNLGNRWQNQKCLQVTGNWTRNIVFTLTLSLRVEHTKVYKMSRTCHHLSRWPYTIIGSPGSAMDIYSFVSIALLIWQWQQLRNTLFVHSLISEFHNPNRICWGGKILKCLNIWFSLPCGYFLLEQHIFRSGNKCHKTK